ncbi:MAG TPA: Ser-Thr-rich GPI-anchored membrane family protein [Chitinivibrionales bacterium]|nr:Ser-Thr-rich GPI-anchored membrane family protein [Chitinivibrionales bacterium]
MKTHVRFFAVTAFCSALVFLCCTSETTSPGGPIPGSTSNGYYILTSPLAGSSYQLNTTLPIRWSWSGTVSGINVSIALYEGDNFVRTITASTVNNGTYNWSIYSVPSGINYHIRITDMQDTTKYDMGGYFRITSIYNGTIAVALPQTGTIAKMDSTLTIRWVTSGSIGNYVRIELYNDSVLSNTVVSSIVDSGEYIWYAMTASAGTGSKYRIRVSSAYDPGIYGESGYFTVLSQYSGTYAVTSPDSLTTWAAGSTYTIQWTTTGNPGPYVIIRLCNDTATVSTLASYLSNSGTLSWNIPASLSTAGTYRIKIISYSDAGIYTYSKPFTIAGIPADAFEPDNRRDQANIITTDGTIQNHTLTMNDTDWVKFSADSGAIYIIRNAGTAYSRDSLFYGTETVSQLSFYNISGSTNQQYVCTRSGTYYLKIIPYYTALYFGDYQLSVSKFDSTTMLKFTNPSSTSVFAAGSSYILSWTADSAVMGDYIALYLYIGNSLITSISTYLSNSGTYTWYVPSGLGSGSAYRIRMVSYNNPSIYGYSANFSISGLAADSYEFDNTRDSAKAISVTGVVQNRSVTLGDTDWVKFSADSGAYYIIRNVGQAYTRDFLFQGTNANSLTSFYGGNTSSFPTLRWTCPATGVYYLQIAPYSSSYTGTYQLLVMKSDSTSLANFSSPVSGTTWASGSTYNLSWDPDSALYGAYVYLYLYSGGAQVLRIATSIANSGSYSWTIPAGIASAANYQIRMVNYSDPSIGGFSQNFTISGLAADSYEPDNSKQQAKTIPVDGTAQTRSLTLADTDWVSFTAQKGMIYLVKGSAASSFYLYLYQDTGTVLLTSTYSASPTIPWTCPASGTYYVRTFCSSGYLASYNLWIKEYSSYNMATFINPTHNSTWSTGSAYTIQWTPDTALFGTYVRLYLCRDTVPVQTITTLAANLTGSYQCTPLAGLATDTVYRIRITSSLNSQITGLSAQFTISGVPSDVYEPDNVISQAHTIALNATPELHTLSLADSDWCKFSAAADMMYAIKTLGGIYPKIELFSADGSTSVATANSTGTDSNAVMYWMCQTSGDYAFKISSARTGPYQVSVTSYDSTQYRFSVTSPSSGAQVKQDSVTVVQWSSPVPIGGYVDLFLYDNANGVATIDANVPNTGSYSWAVFSTKYSAGNNYYIKVISRYGSNIFGQSQTFSIVP